MSEHFKKGQIVPKRLRMVFTHRKAQINVRFGCDVEVDGRVIRPVGPVATGVICAETWKGIRRNNGTYQKARYLFQDMHIDAQGVSCSAAFRLLLNEQAELTA